ncbi:MAG: sugar phosphate nucleotidyltransferase, partial [Bacilli bacterium]
MFKNVLGICDLHNSPSLGKLTDSRPLAAVTFLGRYGLMDFTLSNFSNSGIDKVAILVKNHYYAISSHVQSGQIWVNNTKTGFQKIIYNESCSNELFNTDISNILASRLQLENYDVEYIVIAPAHFLASIDFRPIIESHIENKNDITIVYHNSDKADKEFLNCTLLNLDPRTGTVKSTSLNSGKDKYATVSLDTFIFTKEAFNNLLMSQKNISTL